MTTGYMTMKKVYICADRRFPHGDAGGNRIEYMAHCALAMKVQPVVISMSSNAEGNCNKLFSNYHGIMYHNVLLRKGKLRLVQQYFYIGMQIGRVLRTLEIETGSVVIIYSSNPIFCLQVRQAIPKHCRVVYDVVEWFDESCYKYGKLDPRFWVFQWCFNGVYPKGDGIIAISQNIERHFLSLDKKVIRFPICLDVDKFAHIERRRQNHLVRLIYPGNPQNKDDVKIMLKALLQLNTEELNHIEFHFTAVKKQTIEVLLGEDTGVLSELGDRVIFHDWMEYDELLQLYGSIDALYMLRFDNLVANSNFPSKVPELLSCGVAVIANDIGDFYEYLTDGINAIKIETNDVEGCTHAIRRYLRMDEYSKEQMSIAAIRCARERFTYLEYAQKLVTYLEEV